MNKDKLLIIADDLTGALDTGVQFAKNKIEVRVYLSPPVPESNDENILVDVINTDSRHLTPDKAALAVKSVVEGQKKYTYFYKKTDSCLRGNIGAELEALMQATGSQCLPFVPAYPQMKRFTRKGFQYLAEQLIHESSMADDPLNPISESYIPAIIGKQSAVHVQLIPLNDNIPALEQTPGILVFDSETKKDMVKIAAFLREKRMLKTSAGCAGFAEALMEVLPLEKNANRSEKPIKRLPVLVVSGSLHPVSINQVNAAVKNRIPGIYFDVNEALQPDWQDSQKAKSIITVCSRELADKGICVLGTNGAFGINSETAIKQDRMFQTESGTKGKINCRIPNAIGKLVKGITEKTGALHLVIFGGDTLLGISRELGYKCIKPVREIRPGIVLAKIPDSKDGNILVTKAGAFGEENLIFIIREFLLKGNSDA